MERMEIDQHQTRVQCLLALSVGGNKEKVGWLVWRQSVTKQAHHDRHFRQRDMYDKSRMNNEAAVAPSRSTSTLLDYASTKARPASLCFSPNRDLPDWLHYAFHHAINTYLFQLAMLSALNPGILFHPNAKLRHSGLHSTNHQRHA